MGQYIDREYLISVIGDQALRTIISARLSDDAAWAYTDPDVHDALNTAIAAAEGIAEAKLGRRFSPAELDELQDEVVIRESIARIAAYKLAPSMMPRSEELRADFDRSCTVLKEIAKRELAAGRSDPDPPPTTAELVATTSIQGLDALSRF